MNEIKLKNKKSVSIFLSFVTMIFGTLIMAILNYYGIFSSWVTFLTVIFAAFVYIRFYSKQKFGFYAYICLVPLLLGLGAIVFPQVVKFQIEQHLSTAQAFEAFGNLFLDVAQKNSYILNGSLVGAFSIVGIIFVFLFNRFRPVTQEQAFEQLPPKPEEVFEGVSYVEPQSQSTNRAVINDDVDEGVVRDTADYCLLKYEKILLSHSEKANKKSLTDLTKKTLCRFQTCLSKE